MKKVMKFVKGKREEETPIKNVSVETKKVVNEKIDDTPREDDFISRDKSITKLHKAVWNENSDKLKSIIKTHDIDITDKLDRTALYFAVLKNNSNIVNLLLENSANQNIPDIDGITPFLKSVQLGYKQCAANLLSYGADLKKTDKDSNSCLHFAVVGKQTDMLSFLLEHNADFNVPNVNGEYPLHIAIQMQDKQMVEILLNHNADINIVNNSGLTPLMLAEQLKNSDIVEILENYSLKNSKENNLFPDELSHKSSYENVNTPKINQKHSSKPELDKDTWNDSPIITPSKKHEKPLTRISKFFNEEIEITEEKSESDVSVKCSENTSPQSGIIPPPCKPLRSLEYLQSGMVMENRPVHLLTLGTVRTRHISMTESDHSKNNTPHRYSYQGDFQAAGAESFQKIPDHFSAADERGDSVNISVKSKLLSKLECDSTMQSDWGSNESLPLDELSVGGKKEKSVTSSTSKNNSNNSNSGSIRDKTTDTFLQKQFSLLEDYEKNREKRCSVSYEIDLLTVKVDKNKENAEGHFDDIGNLLEDNNRINTQLEKYAGQTDTLVGTTKSKSLPRNCEPYNSYHKGSFSLPRTLESGKDPFREMRSYGYFKPRSHFSFSLKMLRGDKKTGFIDKLKSMFNKKSQIHLTEQSENGTWLYKKTDNEYCSSNADGSFSGSESAKKGDNLPTSKTLNNFSDLRDFDNDSSSNDPSFSNNEQNKVIEKKILSLNNMSRESSHTRIASSSSTKCANEQCPYVEEDSEAKYKYNDELQKLRAERCRAPDQDQAVSKLKEEAERWKKQFNLVTKVNLEGSTARGEGTEESAEITKTTTDEEKWRSIIQSEVTTAVNILKENSQVVISSLEKQNKKLETMVEKLQKDLDVATDREDQLHKDLQSMKDKLAEASAESEKIRNEYDKNYEDTMKTVVMNNEKLKADLEKMSKLYTDLQTEYEENMKSMENDFKKSSEINEEFNIVKDDYRALTRSLSSLSEEIVKAKENALTKNEELRQQVAEMGPAANMKQFINTITESLESIEMTCACKPGNEVSEQVTELNNSIADVEKINKLNSDIELKILEVKTCKKINCLEEENKKLNEDIVQKCDSLISKVRESGEELEVMSTEIRSKNDVIENQCLQIYNLSEIIDNEKQKNDMLECDMECMKTEIQKEKTSNTILSRENNELKSDLEAFLLNKKTLEEENESMKSSLSEKETINEELDKKLQEAIATINEMKAIIQASQDRMEKLEKANQELKETVDSLKNAASAVKTNEYEDKINYLVEENKTLKHQLEMEKENIISLKKHIDSLQFYHENEMKANNVRLDEIKDESNAYKINMQTEIDKLTNMNTLLQQKLDAIEDENKQLQNNITELNDEITALNDKLQNTDILQDPQKYVDALDAINQENIEMKTAMNVLREILEVKLGEKVNSVSDLLEENTKKKINTEQNELSEKSPEFEEQIVTIDLTDNCNKIISCKQICGKRQNIDKSLVQKVNSIEKKIDEIVDDVSFSPEDIKSTSMPNLDDIGDDDFETTDNVVVPVKSAPTHVVRKSSSLDFIGRSEKIDDKNCCESKWEKHLESIHKLRNELTEILAKIDDNRKGELPISTTESTTKIYTEKYKQVINSIQKQINELQEKSVEGNIKNNGLQEELKEFKGQMGQQSQMEDEVYRLRKELYKQKVERIKDTEVAKIKRDAEILAAQQQLKSQYLESKKKLLLDLTAVQNALQVKNEEENKIKQKCDELIKEVTANQKARKKKLHDISLIATQPLSSSNVKQIVICDVTGASQSVCKPECSGYPEKPVKPHALVINARKKLNALEKHRLSTESVPEQLSSDEELKKKYLLL